ncbi:ABC transporter permease [Baekduia alba]|uniref:ABC transporter permease n=1 Tax=Baekduia alba TaxID=2997333 RepID=UPI0023422FCF|nr:hypothetical protein [Baekduia alba]
MLAGFLVIPVLSGDGVTTSNAYDVSQYFASLGLVALALTLTMVAGEFDLSVPATYLLGSMVAVKVGGGSPLLGVVVAVLAAAAAGVVQGAIVAKLNLNSMSVTLGGYLAIIGVVYLLGHSKTVQFDNFTLGADLDQARLFGVVSLRALIAFAVFAATGAILTATRLGAELRAVGADRRSARTAGVRVDPVLIAVFATSGALCALAGALQGFALSYAEPTTSTTSLVFAATSALLGGVSLSGGVGTVRGVACGVIALSLLQELLAVLAVSDYVNDLITGGLLVVVALLSAPDLLRRWRAVEARRRGIEPSITTSQGAA